VETEKMMLDVPEVAALCRNGCGFSVLEGKGVTEPFISLSRRATVQFREGVVQLVARFDIDTHSPRENEWLKQRITGISLMITDDFGDSSATIWCPISPCPSQSEIQKP
jgi:hypothetical protein